MKKFLVLYRSNVSTPERMGKATPEQNQTLMAAWRAWSQRSAGAIVELGAPLNTPTFIKGTSAPGFVGGFSIVQADSADAAKKIFDGHPHFENAGNSLELLEYLPMSGA